MKNHFSLKMLSISAIYAISMAACNKDVTTVAPISTSQGSTQSQHHPHASLRGTSSLETELYTIGDYHNETLEMAYENLPNVTADNYSTAIGVIQSVLSDRYSDESTDAVSSLLEHCTSRDVALGIIETMEENALTQTSSTKNAANRLVEAVDEAADVTDFEDRVFTIYQDEVADNPDAEVALKSMCGIAIGSYSYWSDSSNVAKWTQKQDQTESTLYPRPDNAMRAWICADLLGSLLGPVFGVGVSLLVGTSTPAY